MKRERLHVKRRILRNAILLALLIPAIFLFTGASPTPRLALSRALAGYHFGPYTVVGSFTLPALDTHKLDTHYYLTQCQDWFCLNSIDRVGFLWREGHLEMSGRLPQPLFGRLVKYNDYAEGKAVNASTTQILADGTQTAWLIRCTDPDVVRVAVTECRTYDNGVADSAKADAQSLGNGLWLAVFLRPAPVGASDLVATIDLSPVLAYNEAGNVVCSLDRVGGVGQLHSGGDGL